MLRRVALRLPSLLSRTQQVRLFSAGGSPLNISSDNAGHRYAFGDEAQVDDSAGWNGKLLLLFFLHKKFIVKCR
jgi:hypothetical protein